MELQDIFNMPLPIRELNPGALEEIWAVLKPLNDSYQGAILVSMKDNNEVPTAGLGFKTQQLKFKKGAVVIRLKDGTYVYNKDDLV